MTTPAQLYANEKVEWGSPDWLIKRSTALLGNIDLDPASSLLFNERVNADHIFTEGDSALTRAWTGARESPLGFSWGSRVFLNPPGRLTRQFWEKLVNEWELGNVAEAIWVGFNMDHLRYLGESRRWPLEFPTLIPRKRIRFVHEDGTVSTKPSAANYVTYLPVPGHPAFGRAAFKEVFGEYGRIV